MQGLPDTSISDWSFKNNKKIYIYGGVALSALLYKGISYLYDRFRTYTLSKWLNEYMSEVKQQLSELKDKNSIPVNLLAYSFNLHNEIVYYLYRQDYKHIEDERRSNVNNNEKYEELVMQTMGAQESVYKIANKILMNNGIDINQIQEFIQSCDEREIQLAMLENKKKYSKEDMPTHIESSVLKEAFIVYAKTQSSHLKIKNQQLSIMKMRPDYQETGMKIILQNKFLLQDLIMNKYGFESKYITQLIEDNNLLEDNEIKYYYDEIKQCSVM